MKINADVQKNLEDLNELVEMVKPYLELANNDMIIEVIKHTIKTYLEKPPKEIEQIFDTVNDLLIKKIAENRKKMFKELQLPKDDTDKFSFNREEAFALVLKDASMNKSFMRDFLRNIKQERVGYNK